MIWGELPGAWALFGMVLIVAGGFLVFLQERSSKRLAYRGR